MTLKLQRIKRIGGPGSNDLAAYVRVLSAWATGATLTEGDVALLGSFVDGAAELQTQYNLALASVAALQTQHNTLVTLVTELQTQYNLLCAAVDEAALASVSDFTDAEADEDFSAVESVTDFSDAEADEDFSAHESVTDFSTAAADEDFAALESVTDFAAIKSAIALAPPTTIDG